MTNPIERQQLMNRLMKLSDKSVRDVFFYVFGWCGDENDDFIKGVKRALEIQNG